MRLAVLMLALAVGCATQVVTPTRVRPSLVVDSPAPHELVHTPEIEVCGHYTTSDGRAWIYADAMVAESVAGAFVAHRVPTREGAMELGVDLTDGHGGKVHVVVPIVVETPDRPRSSKLCKPDLGCLRYEERGVPVRDAAGRITNAVVVISAFGFDERLDELWPDLVGPDRAIDTRKHFVVGVAGGADQARHLPGPDALLVLLDELLTTRAIDRGAALIGASSYGAELALRVLARRGTRGPVLLCGGHDRPQREPSMQRVQQVLADAHRAHRAEPATWLQVSLAMVPVSYTAAYLADPTHAVEHGIPAAEAAHDGLTAALAKRQAAHFEESLPLAELERRMAAAFSLGTTPLVYPPLEGRRVVLIANRDDRMMQVANIRELGERLAARGADVRMVELTDPLGHSVFFRRVAPELERAVAALLGDVAQAPR